MTGEQRGRDQAEGEREVFRRENLPYNVYNYLLYTVWRDVVLARAECLERDQRGGGRDQLLITEDMTRPERIQVTLRHTASHCVTLRHTASHCVTLCHTVSHCVTLRHSASHCVTLHCVTLLMYSGAS